MKRKVIYLVALLAICTACGTRPGAKTASLFPESGDVEGWTKARETRTFKAEDLWQYIDGDNQKYLQAGVEKTLTSDYRYKGKTDAVVDIYVMGTAEGSRKVFDSESGEGSIPVALGDAGRLYAASATFRHGRYFVRLTAYENAPEIGNALMALGKAVDSRLGHGD
ncbi:MAG: DUF6599 family protein [Bryobacteraceae bacterium]